MGRGQYWGFGCDLLAWYQVLEMLKVRQSGTRIPKPLTSFEKKYWRFEKFVYFRLC